MKLPTFKKGGIHVPENKYTPADKITTVELPMHVAVPLKQHIGMPSSPIVKRGEKVKRGQKIAEAQGRVSAPVHAPISGVVEKIDQVTNLFGYSVDAIYIKATEEDHATDEMERIMEPHKYEWTKWSPEELIGTIADAGVVGLGGATFPTAMKLSPPAGTKVRVLLINAAECEPYLTCDDALMRERTQEIVIGIEIMMKASKAPKAIIGIENNKPEAYDALAEAIKDKPNIKIQKLQTKYPQGGEKQLIQALTGNEVPSGGLPISVGAIVQNVATAYAVYLAVVVRQPLIEKVITVVPYGNYRVTIGMMLDQLPINVSAENVYDQADVIIGGPMMGKSAATLSAPIEKGTSGVTTVQPLKYDPQPCIRCGACINACPMGLEPYLLSNYGKRNMIDEAVEIGVLDCIECGSCNYSCPSARPIVDYIRLAKTSYRNRPRKN